jgi:[acyl-carrier-protein] S-malonyltransferase
MFDLLADAPEAAPVFAAASGVLAGRDPRHIVREGNDTELHKNKTAQILCCTEALAAWAVLAGSVQRPLVVAGYSVGELAAWGVAGILDLPTVFSLATARADAMDAATEQASGLLAVRGLSLSELEPVCRAHHAYVAIIDGLDMIIVGGANIALDAVTEDAIKHGAQHTTRLSVTVPAHTPLLRRASEVFRGVLHDRVAHVELPEGIRLLSGIDGNAVFSTTGLDKLADQIAQTVDWAACVEACREAGVTKAVELGPGSALARMMRDAAPEVDARSVAEFHSLDGLKRWIGKTA